jgi:hypothetical protein
VNPTRSAGRPAGSIPAIKEATWSPSGVFISILAASSEPNHAVPPRRRSWYRARKVCRDRATEVPQTRSKRGSITRSSLSREDNSSSQKDVIGSLNQFLRRVGRIFRCHSGTDRHCLF